MVGLRKNRRLEKKIKKVPFFPQAVVNKRWYSDIALFFSKPALAEETSRAA